MNIKKDFPIFNDKNLIYFDSASTTQKPNDMINAMVEFYSTYNANVHRGAYSIAEKATQKFENARSTIANFINCKNEELILTKGATESINLIAYTFGMNLNDGDEIIISEMEHHSNILPWQMLIKNKKIKLKYIPIDKNGSLKLNALDTLINNKTKLISIIHMSNVLGTINPIEKIISKAKNKNIPVLVDASQSISHQQIDVKKIKCDFLVFSGHKMMGPTGIGGLYINKQYLNSLEPFLRGGHMIKEVELQESTWNDSPWKFEAGTANIAQTIGLAKSIDYINNIGLKNIKKHEDSLLDYFLIKLKTIDNIKIYGHTSYSGPIVSFNIKNCHPFDISKLLDTYGICIRAGHHCAQILMKNLNINYTNRVSLFAYNTKDEIDYFIKSLKEVISKLI